MKKFNILICILLIIFTLTACGETEQPTNAPTSTAPATAITALTTSTAVPESSSVAAETETTTETLTATETNTVVTTSVTTTESTTAYSTTEATTTKPTTTKQQTITEATTTKPTTTKKQTTSKVTTTEPITTTKPTTITTKPATTKPSTTAPTTQVTTEMKKYCTVRIKCNTIYDNLSKLKSGKKDFLPSNGVILNNVKVELNGGESAFDVIKKACEENVCTDNCKYCKANGVQIEYTYTPAFNNYYIEGIHQIYEKDCGTQSGWMYSVNGVFPDVGTSSYSVSPGDVIVFSFTCNMGEDIGNSY
ncbi:MAG: DUF4430 domain-containing protein [Ruminococcaceae bacterium]|nr:DUF4430 domain-containing protein [Oscillospiraceae bacterium]